MSTAQNLIAGAPISWGVCEVLGWGYQLPPDRVLTEMREIGLAATELGPGLPSRRAGSDGRRAVPAPTACDRWVHPAAAPPPRSRPAAGRDRGIERYGATGARTLVLSADSGVAGYDSRPTLDEQGWATLLAGLDRIDAVAAEQNVRAVLHRTSEP